MSEAQNDDFEAVMGRQAPFSQLGDWVLLAGASAPACKLYWLLTMHVNLKRNNREVWPTRALLAERMGYARTKAIDPYIAELENLGAITAIRAPKVKGTAQAATRYIVHQDAPPGFGGLRSNAEYYAQRNAPAQTRVPSGGHPPQGEETPAQTRVPSGGHPPVSPEKDTPVSPGGDSNRELINNKTNTTLTGGVHTAHGAPEHEDDSTTTTSTGPSDRVQDHAHNSTVEYSGSQEESGRHTRLSLDWRPSSQMWAKAQAKLPYLDLEEETEEFIRYWAMEMPARHPKSARARKPASWERIDWDGTWWNRMRDRWHRLGLDRRAPVPAPKVDEQATLFDPADGGHAAVADEIVRVWLGQDRWYADGGAVMPGSERKLRAMVLEALAAGAQPERVKRALVELGEPVPAPFRFQDALLGVRPQAAAGGGMSKSEAEQKYRDERSAREWQMVQERGPNWTAADSRRALVLNSMRKAGIPIPGEEQEQEQDSTPGPEVPPWAVLKGELA